MTAAQIETAPAAPPGDDEVPEAFWRRSLWVLPALVAAVLTFLIMVVLPADRTIDNLGDWAFRISPVVFAVIAASLFPARTGRNLVLLALLILGYMGVLDTLNAIRIAEYAGATDHNAAFPRMYQMTVFLDAFLIIAVCFGYRLGGAKTNKVLRLGVAGVLVLVSGLNDLTFYYFYKFPPPGRPARLDWASHIKVFVGGSPTPTTAILFCAVHLLLAAAVIVVPWYVRRRRVAAAAGTATVDEAASGHPAAGGDLSPAG